MSDRATQEALVERLSDGLRPVRRLPAPIFRATVWFGLVGLGAVLLSRLADLHAVWLRLMAAPDMWLSQAGAMLTAFLAAWAAFQTSVPGRSPHWAWLPVPAFLLWIGASGAGCMRLTAIPGTQPEPMTHPMVCLSFVLMVSVPLASLLTWRLMRACAMRPALTAVLAGLASAGASASLLALLHPFDATAEDLMVHLVAVLTVIGACKVFGGRVLEGK